MSDRLISRLLASAGLFWVAGVVLFVAGAAWQLIWHNAPDWEFLLMLSCFAGTVFACLIVTIISLESKEPRKRGEILDYAIYDQSLHRFRMTDLRDQLKASLELGTLRAERRRIAELLTNGCLSVGRGVLRFETNVPFCAGDLYELLANIAEKP